MAKSADAFRTISEVADWLETPAHVLRFWESKFAQVKPVKRAGGRRYYRPQDMRLLGGIKKLLHDDGMTIKGVQKLLRDKGVRHVAALSAPLTGETEEDARAWAAEAAEAPRQPEPAQVLDFRRQDDAPEPAQDEAAETAEEPAAPPAVEPPAGPEPETDAPQPETAETPDTAPAAQKPPAADPAAGKGRLPAFLSRPLEEAPSPPTPEPADEAGAAEPAAAFPVRPATIDVPPDPDDSEFARPGILSRIAGLPRPLPASVTEAARPLLKRLDALRRNSGGE